MKFKDFVVPGAICIDLAAEDKRPAVREMVEALREAGSIAGEDVESVVRTIMKREEVGSTGIGKGVAVPHAKHPKVKKLIGSVARSVKGVEFSALDGQPVKLLFLLISPPDAAGSHIKALERIFTLLKNDDFCRFALCTEKAVDMMELLKEADQKIA
jgi:PTS system fructose-specific IIA component/PTS system nitrogen regulatory IIA component